MGNVIKFKPGQGDSEPDAQRDYTGVCHGGPIDKATLSAHGTTAKFNNGAYRWLDRAWYWGPLA